MKKLLMVGAILALGTTMAYGAVEEAKATADVTVKAKIVADNLTITDLNGRPIVLDFKKINKLDLNGTSRAIADYKVTYVGTEALSKDGELSMKLGGKTVPVGVELVQQDSNKPDKFEAMVALTEYTGVMPKTTDESTNTEANVYVGEIRGEVNHATARIAQDGQGLNSTTGISLIDNADYLGTTVLEVTLAAQN